MIDDVPEDEARALLAEPSVCPEIGPWIPKSRPLVGYEAGAGLLDESGNPRGMSVQLDVAQGRKTRLWTYRFTVYRLGMHSPSRVYQLEVTNFPTLPKDKHAWPHEHIGRGKVVGDAGWLRWSYDAVLARFKLATNITFVPDIDDPSVFKLEG
jgi:hypothetical protein